MHPLASLRCLSALASFLVCLFAPATAFADRFIVTRHIDRADDRPGDGECRSGSLGCTLRAAVQEASARPAERHIIVLPPGFFNLFVGGRDENSSFEGDLDIHGEIAIEGTIRPEFARWTKASQRPNGLYSLCRQSPSSMRQRSFA